jgi:hypothetical protein
VSEQNQNSFVYYRARSSYILDTLFTIHKALVQTHIAFHKVLQRIFLAQGLFLLDSPFSTCVPCALHSGCSMAPVVSLLWNRFVCMMRAVERPHAWKERVLDTKTEPNPFCSQISCFHTNPPNAVVDTHTGNRLRRQQLCIREDRRCERVVYMLCGLRRRTLLPTAAAAAAARRPRRRCCFCFEASHAKTKPHTQHNTTQHIPNCRAATRFGTCNGGGEQTPHNDSGGMVRARVCASCYAF